MPPTERASVSAMPDRKPFQTIGVRHPVDQVDRIEADAKRLGLSQAEWMRMAVELTLERQVPTSEAGQYRRPATKAEQREVERQREERAAQPAAQRAALKAVKGGKPLEREATPIPKSGNTTRRRAAR